MGDYQYGSQGTDERDDTTQDNLKAISGVNKGYMEVLETKMREEVDSHSRDVKEITKKSMALDTSFYKKSGRVQEKINVLSDIIGLKVLERESLVRQMQSRQKSEEFKNQLKDRTVVDKDDFLLLKDIIECDQFIQPMLALLGETAVYGFKSTSSLVDVTVSIPASEKFIGTIKEMVDSVFDRTDKLIENSKAISESVVNIANKRQDEDISELRKNMTEFISTQIMCNGAIENNRRDIIALQGHGRTPKEYPVGDTTKNLESMQETMKLKKEPETEEKEATESKPPIPPIGHGFDGAIQSREQTIDRFVDRYYKEHNKSFQGMHTALSKEFNELTVHEQEEIAKLKLMIKQAE